VIFGVEWGVGTVGESHHGNDMISPPKAFGGSPKKLPPFLYMITIFCPCAHGKTEI
jgi:hypothetical protein